MGIYFVSVLKFKKGAFIFHFTAALLSYTPFIGKQRYTQYEVLSHQEMASLTTIPNVRRL